LVYPFLHFGFSIEVGALIAGVSLSTTAYAAGGRFLTVKTA